ncbi:NAD-dependent epimerase/dehydratase family protein [Paenochrobactrum pullorum]|uniref:NAD-dependent epimerase/dehydratase family protein n=1 Tax=Paenochrobactrum pullorum TaxID=1324351 RepID=UPI0035BBD2AE
MKNDSVLVIGGSGFVGRQVVNSFLSAHKKVTVLNRGNIVLAGVEQLIADRNDINALKTALMGRHFDVVIDTNCYTPLQAHYLTQVLQETSRNIIVISSASVYADDATQPPTEKEPTGGASVWSVYGKEKSGMEEVYRLASHAYDKCIILRPPYIFGPQNSSDRETWFWVRQAANKPVLLPGNGLSKVQFIHVEDVANAILQVAEADYFKHDTFNIADPTILTFSQHATLLAQVAGFHDKQIAVGTAASGADARSWFPFRDYPCLASSEKIGNQLGWYPKQSLFDSFKSTLQHYQLASLIKTMMPTSTEDMILKRLGIY